MRRDALRTASRNDDEPDRYLSREEAAEEFAKLGLPTITARKLRRLAERREGPTIYREGKTPYYRRSELLPWAQAARLVEERDGRASPAR